MACGPGVAGRRGCFIKVAYYDLECFQFSPHEGILLCCGIYPAGGEPYVIYQGRKGANDKRLVAAVKKELSKYDLLFGFNSLTFDWRYINSRCLKWGLGRIPHKLHCDLYREAKKIFKTTKFTRCSLATICRTLGIKGKGGEEKGHVDLDHWCKVAYGGDRESLKKIVRHCKEDIMVLEPLFRVLSDNIVSISKA